MEVLGGGDLEVLPGRGDEANRAAGELDEPGVVGGGGQRRVAKVGGALQGATAERLRRLYRPQARAVHRAHHDLPGALLERVGEGSGGDRRLAVVIGGRVEARLDDGSGEPAPRPASGVDESGGKVDEARVDLVSGNGEASGQLGWRIAGRPTLRLTRFRASSSHDASRKRL